ncbi:LytR/AlgR family response regulator transcription factor [Schinkia azotoformans]|uniref:LytR/AlgR family response regulator transcription factor n=2 Tax=Schinkia azotoformans TaxID=1454 RepID=UPI002DBE5364|nr:LytTR family DNA-binding domain-containing protein [Schinkia azotoformans]MEC1786829.1 LytTR family DNA-binding domain-containing protein [Schinkia azotoformans]
MKQVKDILIIEDDVSLRKYLIAKANKINSRIGIKSTDSAGEALQIAREYDIMAFFIDIQLVDYSGLEFAKQIRELDKYLFTPIVLITAIPTYELEAYRQVHCYEYIIKPFTDEELTDMFERILVGYIDKIQNHEKKICLDMNGITQLIDTKEVIFVEYKLRKINLYFRDSVLKYKHVPLKKFAEQLTCDFIQVHQSIIINRDFIQTIDRIHNYIILKYINIKIPIGKSYRKEVGDCLNDFF